MLHKGVYLNKFFIIIISCILLNMVISVKICWSQISDEEQIQRCVEDFLEGIRLADIDRFMKNISNSFMRVSKDGKFVDKLGFKKEVLSLWEKFALTSLDNIEMEMYIIANKAGVVLRCRLKGELLPEHKKKEAHKYYFLLFEKNENWKLISWYDLPIKEN